MALMVWGGCLFRVLRPVSTVSTHAARSPPVYLDLQSSLTFDPSENVNAGDKLLRAQMLDENGGDGDAANPDEPRGSPSVAPSEALAAGWDFYSKLLTDDGHWAGDYGGPLFLMPGLVITAYMTGVDLGERASAMLTYLRNQQQTDGGWGLHIEGPSTLFGTTMNYVATRLLGVPPEDKVRACAAASACMWFSVRTDAKL